MMTRIKYFVKKVLAQIGILHPSLGIKMGGAEKAAILLGHKVPGINILVETGTHKGEMIDKIGNNFKTVYSIELDDSLFREAKKKFSNKDNIKILHGDSGVEINKVLTEIDEPALFWLDAHGSGIITSANSPIEKELEAIFAHPIKSHVIIIDDARHFDRHTISRLKGIAKLRDYRFIIKDGIFILYERE